MVGFYWLGFGYAFEDGVRQWFVVFFFCFTWVRCLLVVLVWMFSVSLDLFGLCYLLLALLIVLLWCEVRLFCRFWLLIWFGCDVIVFCCFEWFFCLRCFFCVKLVVLSFVVVNFFYAPVDLSFVIFACAFVLVWWIECWIGNMFCFIVYVVCICFNSVVWYLFSFFVCFVGCVLVFALFVFVSILVWEFGFRVWFKFGFVLVVLYVYDWFGYGCLLVDYLLWCFSYGYEFWFWFAR